MSINLSKHNRFRTYKLLVHVMYKPQNIRFARIVLAYEKVYF